MKQQSLCDDKGALVAYLYGECDDAERRQVEQHLAGCAKCAADVRALRGVRGALREWTPPEQALGFRVVRDAEARVAAGGRRRGVARLYGWLSPMPAWAQLAAAVLVLAAGAAIANLDVRIGNGGVSIHTGWQKPAVAPAVPGADTARLRLDMAAFERQVRDELASIRVSASTAPAPGVTPVPASAGAKLSADDRAALLRQMEPVLQNIADRQQREMDRQMADRFLRFARDVDSQRAADLRLIQQGLGQIDARTTTEVADLRRLVRVANVQQMK